MLTGDSLMDNSCKTVYASNMPITLPPFLVARQLTSKCFWPFFLGSELQ